MLEASQKEDCSYPGLGLWKSTYPTQEVEIKTEGLFLCMEVPHLHPGLSCGQQIVSLLPKGKEVMTLSGAPNCQWFPFCCVLLIYPFSKLCLSLAGLCLTPEHIKGQGQEWFLEVSLEMCTSKVSCLSIPSGNQYVVRCCRLSSNVTQKCSIQLIQKR